MLQATAQRVQDVLTSLGFDFAIQELANSTRTAAEAAAAVGTTVAQIAKSIVFKDPETERSVLVVTSGINRVDEKKVAALLGHRVAKADAAFVREKTGFVIGGVPPLGHQTPPIVFLDEDLWQYEEIWAAGGHPFAVFPLTPAALMEMTQGQAANIKVD